MKLFTSIAPTCDRAIDGVQVGERYITGCIRSWQAAGFDIVSLNPAEEAKTEIGGVKYIETKGRPTMADFVEATLPERRAGIINSDVFLLSFDRPWIKKLTAMGGMAMLGRADVTMHKRSRCWGFDGFLFDVEPLRAIDREGIDRFRIGRPWWDYWLPVAYRLAGGRIAMPEAAVICHLVHKRAWADDHEIDGYALSYFRRRPVPPGFPDAAKGFALWCHEWLVDGAQILKLARNHVQTQRTGAQWWLKKVLDGEKSDLHNAVLRKSGHAEMPAERLGEISR